MPSSSQLPSSPGSLTSMKLILHKGRGVNVWWVGSWREGGRGGEAVQTKDQAL